MQRVDEGLQTVKKGGRPCLTSPANHARWWKNPRVPVAHASPLPYIFPSWALAYYRDSGGGHLHRKVLAREAESGVQACGHRFTLVHQPKYYLPLLSVRVCLFFFNSGLPDLALCG